ncbi:hypothetical protein RSOLAG22IIIB_12441 [Rhizoctonia solani]|uniref:Ribosomal RNA methyltransferase FtsJ domain-containing protein n=1 Tax=Rhizoctonia solani TaxID=456999 RepID=A0A0K6GED2_9AGAM|nr:hypothetical protein RSOLAG22IIIB_12441 [Rhizoctonia solani]
MAHWQSPPPDDATTTSKGGWLRDALKNHPDCQSFRKLGHHWDMYKIIFPTGHAQTDQPTGVDCVGEMTDEEHIGCCPGGYATTIMNICPNATGMGISLSTPEGGHGLAIPQHLMARFDMRWEDLTRYDLAPEWADKPALEPIPFTRNTFDLVVCDAHDRRPQLCPWACTRLLVSQLLLALYGVHPGGRILLTLWRVENPLTAQILLALDRISTSTHTLKSPLHEIRPAFYLLALGIQTNSSGYTTLVHALKKLWFAMTFGGESGQGRHATWAEKEMITPWDEVTSPAGLDLIARLGSPVWNVQSNALLRFLRSQGIEIDIE